MSSESFPCPKCQNKMFAGARFCMRCGNAIEAPPVVRRDTPKPPAIPASGSRAPDPWAHIPHDSGLEAIELSLGEPAPAKPAVIPPPQPKVPAPPPKVPPPISMSRPETTGRIASMPESPRDEVLRKARAKQDLKGAALARVDLSGADLQGLDLSRADLDGAILDHAKLQGAVLRNASLRGASLKHANLEGANLSRADLSRADLSDARLVRAILERASLDGAKLERATLLEASLSAAELSEAVLSAADLSRCDARHAVFARIEANGVRWDGAKLRGASFQGARMVTPIFEWIDVSADGNGAERLEGERAFGFLGGRRDSAAPKTRYFGQGDVLRDATLQFDAGSVIHIDSRFENCLITLGEGAELTIGKTGILSACEIVGRGRIIVHGRFFERATPGIAGARSVTVSGSGAIVGGLEQAPEATQFAFEPGCRLRVKILKPRMPMAAE
jgi:uncharacterized protein YjbI with pentapeptide repeats